jgi:hypothetical protein
MVYYVVYDQDLVEQGRFIEIEMDEKFEWPSDEQAWNELIQHENKLSKLGILPQARVKRSLFEMFIQK